MDYKVMAKKKYAKRYKNITWILDPSAADADFIAQEATKASVYTNVKIVATDDNGVKNEIIYK